jgi:iron complex outermembrane receptor protein
MCAIFSVFHLPAVCRQAARRVISVVAVVAVLVSLVVPPALADDSPVPAWRQSLARVEAGLKSIKADDAPARGRLAQQLQQLRSGVTTWLSTYDPAKNASETWLGPAPADSARIEDLADEVGRLRAAIDRVAASLARTGDESPFYLGRVDVAVSAEATVSATSEMAPAGAVVLDSQDIRAHNTVALAEALALAPGVSFSRVGNRNETTVYVRGFDIRQVPVFIDGIPVYTPYDGYADLGRFTTFDVAELRVSKGFASVLYGPNTLGGAINVISRRPAGRLEGIAGAHYGTGPAWDIFGNAGTRLGRWYAQAGGSILKGDTFPLSDRFVAARYEDGGDRENAYRRDGKFNVKLGVTVRGSDDYSISYVGQRGKKGNPPYAGSDSSVKVRYWKWPYWDKDSVYVISNTGLGKAGYLRGRAYYDVYDNELDSYDDATFTTQKKSSSFQSLYHDDTYGGSVEWNTMIGDAQTFRAAFHLKNDQHRENNVGQPVQHNEGRIMSVGVEDTYTFTPRLSMVAGISGDWQNTTVAEGNEKGTIVEQAKGDSNGVNPQIGFFVGIPSGMLRATVAHKTRLPSIKDRYSYKLGTAIPNPDLQPERATTTEVGYQGTLGSRTALQTSAFYSRIADLIDQVYVSTSVSQQQNIGRASSKGVEIDIRSRVISHVELAASYSYLDRNNLSDPSVPLTETPVHKAQASVTATPLSKIRVMGSVDFESGRLAENQAGRVLDVPSFAVLSMKASWTVCRGLDVDLTVTNIGDRNYWITDGYPEAGRVVSAGLRWSY